MAKPIPWQVRTAVERTIADYAAHGRPLAAEQASYLRAHGRFRPLVCPPWLATIHARQDAEWALQAALEAEDDALVAAGLPPHLWQDGGIDVDAQETLCRQCPQVVVVRGLPTGACVVTNRDGTLHSHAPRPTVVPFGAEARERRRPAVVAVPQLPTPAPTPAVAPPWERWR